MSFSTKAKLAFALGLGGSVIGTVVGIALYRKVRGWFRSRRGRGDLELIGLPPLEVEKWMEETVTTAPEMRWLRVCRAKYAFKDDPNPVNPSSRPWEYVKRTTRSEEGIDGCEIIARLKRRNKPVFIVLVCIYRPPVNRVVVEFPAGLIDSNETVTQAAVRELKEETGYVGTVDSVSREAFVDPYKSTENYKTAFLSINGNRRENITPVPQRESDENMQVLIVREDEMLENLLYVQDKYNYALESKVYAYALGMKAARATAPAVEPRR